MWLGGFSTSCYLVPFYILTPTRVELGCDKNIPAVWLRNGWHFTSWGVRNSWNIIFKGILVLFHVVVKTQAVNCCEKLVLCSTKEILCNLNFSENVWLRENPQLVRTATTSTVLPQTTSTELPKTASTVLPAYHRWSHRLTLSRHRAMVPQPPSDRSIHIFSLSVTIVEAICVTVVVWWGSSVYGNGYYLIDSIVNISDTQAVRRRRQTRYLNLNLDFGNCKMFTKLCFTHNLPCQNH